MEISISGRGLLCTFWKPLPLQLLRVMKLTAILLTLVCIHVSARSYEQTVSFSGKNVPLTAVFTSIEKQTGVSFFFNYALLKGTRPVTLEVRNQTIDIVLEHVLTGQGLSYYKEGKTIFILKKQEASGTAYTSDGGTTTRQIDVKGQVLNHERLPLDGATIIVKHTTKGAVTDGKGMFEIKNVPVDGVLEISYTGYQHKEVPLEGRETVSVELALANTSLDETEVIAYGTTTQRFSTSDITTVKAETIEKQPVDNPLLALEGRVPGLFIQQNSGVSGSGLSILIQGQNSITSGNDPFYVVDGVPFNSQLLPNLGGSILGYSRTGTGAFSQPGNPFSFINPADIESIAVLKGADATAIYGSRAANGAILITTKKGRAGEAKIELNLQNGWGQIDRKLDVLNLKQYLQMRHEALKNDAIITPPATSYDINGFWDSTRSTDWQKTLIGNTAEYTNLYGSISGGTTLTQYLIGATYHRETSVFPGSFADQKGDIHFNLNTSSVNQRFKVQLQGSYLADRNVLPPVDITPQAVQTAPDAPKLYNPDGSLNWAPNATGTSSWANPLASLLRTYTANSNNLVSNAILSYQLIPGLEIRSSFGYNILGSKEISQVPLTYYAPETRSSRVNTANYTNNSSNSWIVEPQISYKRILGQGRVEFLAGGTIQQGTANGLWLSGSGYSSDAELSNIQAASSVTVTSFTNSTYRYNAGFARLTYNLREKYIVNLTGRRDGSSRFGAKNEFHGFAAIGGAWIFSNETFIKNHFKALSFGKLRSSYGTTGNDQIGDYTFLNLYGSDNPGIPYQGIVGLTPLGLSNPYLQWEETKKLEFGLDLSFWKDRLSVSGNYFRNRSSNEILAYSLPIITGFSFINRNFPATVQNSGWELTLNSVNIASKAFSWSSGINITIPRNKLLAFPNLANSSYANLLIVGRSISIIKKYHFLGVNPINGEYQFGDFHGTPTYTPASTDMTAVIDPTPNYYGGLENTFGFKGFTLKFLFQFMKRIGLDDYFGVTDPGFTGYNQPNSVLNRWHRPGDITTIQRFNSNGSIGSQIGRVTGSDAAYKDASFVRLKNISLTWQLPPNWQKWAGFQNTNIFVHAQNLLTFTRYVGIDPETLSSTNLPPLRILTFGLQTTF
jgi:TonB-linked SusC/RagA family outer membrane protein